MTSFDGRMSFSSLPATHAPYASMNNPSHSSNQPSASRSFGQANGHRPQSSTNSLGNPQIYTAVYSSVAVYEMEINGIAVMRRRSDSWLNATQILKVAGVDKGKRTKILEKEILTGEHEKIQGGYGRYQGTWINYHRGREFCRQYGVEDVLRPLLDYDIGSDGTGAAGKIDTPTKEQAMAANRKRFYNASVDSRSGGQMSNGTFFQGISPTASNAIAAMNKAARFESPMPRPGSAQKRPGGPGRQSSMQQMSSQDLQMQGSQNSMHSFSNENPASMDGQLDFSYDSQMNGQSFRNGDMQEPPRKKIRSSFSQHDSHPLDPALAEETPTEPNESFMQSQNSMDMDVAAKTQPASYPTADKATEEKRVALLELFEEPQRADMRSHPALQQLSGKDLDMPLDTSANTALHWAATLARLSLMKLLIERGANIMQGNQAGQTPLMTAVQVNNSFDHGCFPEMLDILGPLIDARDATGRTVLHHIAVSSGIKSKHQSSRYYLESLLEYTVRQGSGSNPSSQQASSFTSNAAYGKKSMTLGRFMAEVVNVQDKGGSTALSLVSLIGNRPIINQLEEVGADFEIPNKRGLRPADFGVFPRNQSSGQQASKQHQDGEQNANPSHVEQIREEIFATTNSILQQTQAQYQAELTKKQELIDEQNAEIRNVAVQSNEEQQRYDHLSRRNKERADRQRKVANLRRTIKEQRQHGQAKGWLASDGTRTRLEPANQGVELEGLPAKLEDGDSDEMNGDAELAKRAAHSFAGSLPSASVLRRQVAAFSANNERLESRLSNLKSRSSELEANYRRVVSLCTGVDESQVEQVLEGLVAAVESEASQSVEVGRVREFLRKVEGVDC